jgi:hypothetical protein
MQVSRWAIVCGQKRYADRVAPYSRHQRWILAPKPDW